jgi:hypothetical protein
MPTLILCPWLSPTRLSLVPKAAREGLAISRQLLASEKFPHHNCIVSEHRDDDVYREYHDQFSGYQKSLFLK